MKVEYHAPPPGAHSGVADYAWRLWTALEKLQAGDSATPHSKPHSKINLYHLGNNRLHESIYAQALATPGVIVLHDAVLQHFMLGTLPRGEYIAEWVYNYGEWRRDLGEELWRERARAAVDPRYFRFPMLRRVVESAAAVIVHNPGAAALARAHGARQVHTIPHFFEPPAEVPDAADAARFRARLGIEPGTVLFGIFGYLRETKRILPCIAAFRRLHAVRPKTALLVAGDVISADLDSALNHTLDRGAAQPIRRMGHLSLGDLNLAAASVDCCLNLRYPAAGETSGIAMHLMGFGKPVAITDNLENSGIPEYAALRVAPGVAEAAELFDHMVMVTDFPRIAAAIGSEARLHLQKRHSLETVALNYWEALCTAAS